mgnify:CR=1 FL=1
MFRESLHHSRRGLTRAPARQGAQGLMLQFYAVTLLLMALASTSLHAGGLQALDDQQLAAVVARDGAALDLEVRINTDADGNPLASLNNCAGVGNPCVLALQFDNRLSGGGEWLVLKDFYTIMRINDLLIDGTETPNSSSAFADPRRFLSQDGQTCLTGQGSGGASPTCTANGLLALKLGFPDSGSAFNADIELALNIGRASVQFGPEGFLPSSDNGRSFLGLRINDRIHDTGQIRVGGSMSMFGF